MPRTFDHEGPSPEDVQRFSDETAYCPDCGAEIWDQADVCPECHSYLAGGTGSRPPVEAWFRQRWLLLTIIIVIIAFLWLVL